MIACENLSIGERVAKCSQVSDDDLGNLAAGHDAGDAVMGWAFRRCPAGEVVVQGLVQRL